MPRRKRSSWGSIHATGRGTWVLRWYEDGPSGRVRRCETVHGSRRDADDRMAEIRVSTAREGTPALSYFWSRYYGPEVDKMRTNTKNSYLNSWRQIEASMGRTPVSAITPMAVQEMLDGMSMSTAKVAKGVLKRTLDYAVRMGCIASNPADLDYRMPEKRVEHNKAVYSKTQIDALLEVFRGTDIEAAIILQACGGLRVGESLAVAVDDIEARDGHAVVQVRRQVMKSGEIAELKTKTSRRSALVIEPYSSRLLELTAGEHLGGWLVDNGLGEPCSRWALKRRWEWGMKRLPPGMEPIPMRNLRNSYETWMHWEEGVPMEVASKLIGHKNARVTEEHYDRPMEEVIIKRAMDSIRF